MSETRRIELSTSDLHGITLSGCRETPFFSTVDGQLCQWIELDLACIKGCRKPLLIQIRSWEKSAARTVVLGQGEVTVRCYAPSLWPGPPDKGAVLILSAGGKQTTGTVAIGHHRPWTLYLLSDCCADDSWAYSDLDRHDRDDYRTTLAELAAGPQNCYNYPSAYQVARFFHYASAEEKAALQRAVAGNRFYLSPVPNQLLCGAFTLSAYPLLLEPYRHWCRELGLDTRQVAAYHMESPTWTNGLVNLFSCAGFRLFGKSLLRYLSPWLDPLEELPILTRLEVAPGRVVYLVLRCNTYAEGSALLAGQPRLNDTLHQHLIPPYKDLGSDYPLSAIPIVGLYGDLHPDLPDVVPIKGAVVGEYNAQEWEYPVLVNGTWDRFAAHVERELGDPRSPARPGLRLVRGGTGSSWEAWMSAAQAEMARFRRAQRDIISARALDAISGLDDPAVSDLIRETVLEVVELGDHAWNGSSQASKELNLRIRRGRLLAVEWNLAVLRERFAGRWPLGNVRRIGAVNTLGWERSCPVYIPAGWIQSPAHLVDLESGRALPLEQSQGGLRAVLPCVPGFGFRELEVRPGAAQRHLAPSDDSPLDAGRMRPLLLVDGETVCARGGWQSEKRGEWQIGPFQVTARLSPLEVDRGVALGLSVEGTPPKGPYELRWLYGLPWPEVIWRGESGGGFVTPGPVERGGDSLLGITGSIFSCGEGLSAADPGGSGCIDFAFDHSGLCGLGGRSTRAAQGTYGERMDADTVRLSVWTSPLTAGRLELYLLANGQNYREAFLDQGGTRRWEFRSALRRRAGAFDDAALYRFACGFSYPAELVDPQVWRGPAQWLVVRGDRGLLPLGLFRSGAAVCCDLYNTLREETSFTLAGPAVEGRTIQRADLLGRVIGDCPHGEGTIAPLAYLRVIIR